jgi:hypothetical protein
MHWRNRCRQRETWVAWLPRLLSIHFLHAIPAGIDIIGNKDEGEIMRIFTVWGRVIVPALFLSLAVVPFQSCSSPKGAYGSSETDVVDWQLGDLNAGRGGDASKSGNPLTVDSPFGSAVQFDGKQDGLFIDRNPLVNLRRFTVEVIFRPDPAGLAEQRFLQMGEVDGERLMMETRLTEDNQWYLDAYVKSGDSSLVLIDKNRLHPTGEWHHLAVVVDEGKMETYVAGKRELEGRIRFAPFKSGRTSIGVRMNKVYWFKGVIARIRVTARCLSPNEFIGASRQKREGK